MQPGKDDHPTGCIWRTASLPIRVEDANSEERLELRIEKRALFVMVELCCKHHLAAHMHVKSRPNGTMADIP